MGLRRKVPIFSDINFAYSRIFVQLDVRDPAAVAKAIDQIEAELGLPNVVINNAAGTDI